MVTKNHIPKIAVVMPYHNNLYDFLIALSRLGQTYVITPRSFRKKTHMAPAVPIRKIYATPQIGPITHAYNPFKLWKMITPDTTHVLVKHMDVLENIVPILIGQAKGAKIIVMIQQVRQSFFRSLLIRCAAWYLRAIKAKVFSVTSSGRDALKKILPDIKYIPACIDPARFSLATIHRQPGNTLRILAIGKYIERKNFIAIVKAVEILRSATPKAPISLTLIGPIGDQAVYNNIVELVGKSSLQNIVTPQSDMAPEKIPDILANHELFILPAASEPLGYAVLEAMAAGLPIITTTEVGSSSYVQNDKNGFILQDAQPETIAKAIRSFIREDRTINTEKIRQFGAYSRLLVERLHAPDGIMQSISSIIS